MTTKCIATVIVEVHRFVQVTSHSDCISCGVVRCVCAILFDPGTSLVTDGLALESSFRNSGFGSFCQFTLFKAMLWFSFMGFTFTRILEAKC